MTGQRLLVCHGSVFSGMCELDLSITHGHRHDVGLQIVGQPARDLCRHFVQRWALSVTNIRSCLTVFRWNYLLRIKVCNALDGRRQSSQLHRLESYPRDAFPRSAIGIQAWGP